MALLMVDQGEQILGELMVNKTTTSQDLVLRLFKNNYVPVDASTEANFTEADFTGYAAVTLTGASWTVTPNAPTLCTYAQQTFTCTVAPGSPMPIYGYYLTQFTSGKLMWAEVFTGGPYTITYVGDLIKVTPNLNIKKAGE